MLSDRQLFLRHLAQTSDFPLMLEIEKAEGLWLYDRSGQKYADLISGISVSNIGHRHPKVVEAIKKQTDAYLHLMVYGEYVQSPQVQLAALLAAHLPGSLNNIYLVNSGTEATEGALKLAKRYNGRPNILSCRHSYHGSTHGALSLMGNEFYKQAFRPLLPGTGFIEYNKPEDLEKINRHTSAVFVETIQGEAGVRVASTAYMKQLRKRCTETSTLLVLDEIQAGMGRTGNLWAFEYYDIIPDILLLAKGLGAGMPIGAFIASSEIMSVLKNDPWLGHITTFGGHPVSAAAALAGLKVLIEGRYTEQVSEKETLFLGLLKHPLVKEIRSKGLLIAVQMEHFAPLKKVIDLAIQKGVLTDWFLHCDNAMRLSPPLTITADEIKWCCYKLLEAMDEVQARQH